MKKLTLLFSLLVVMLVFTACNDDPDTSTDTQIEKDITGTWHLTENTTVNGDDGSTTEVYTRDVVLTIGDHTYSYTWHTKTSTKDVTYSVSGAWRLRKSIMMLSYDISSLQATGVSEADLKALRTQMANSNALYDDLKDGNQIVGMGVTVSRTNNIGVLSLTNNSDLAGTYNLVRP